MAVQYKRCPTENATIPFMRPASKSSLFLNASAKAMRSNQTDAEHRLWHHLCAQRFMGLKFKRQKPVGTFIVDFVCMELKLVIEADGGQHGDAHDRQRDDWLAQQGYTVLRFWNNDILQHTEAVLERIRQEVVVFSVGGVSLC
jgi:very-short-patch-repair endonuclease